MLTIDGSHGEGGGQLVRTALALSTILNKPVKITNIRQGRKKPGLKAQHLHCIRALQQLCGAKADGDHLGSEELLYIPGDIKAKTINIDIGTAGSITLLMQAVLLPCMFANKSLTISAKGGTDTAWSMPFEYWNEVVLPQFKKVCPIDAKLLRRGYYPKGGGEIEVKVKPNITRADFPTEEAFLSALKQIQFSILDQGNLITIKGTSHASKDLQDARVAERQAQAAELILKQENKAANISCQYYDTPSKGSGITLWAICSTKIDDIDPNNPIRLGADALGEQRVRAEDVGTKAGKKLLEEINSGAPVDVNCADNLIPLLGLCCGQIRVSEISNHTRTNIFVTEQFLPVKFEIEKKTIRVMPKMQA